MYKTILVPVDLAHVAEGKAILDVAAKQADEGAKIILLNVIEEIPTWAAAEIPKEIIDRSAENVRSEIEGIANASGMKMDTVIRSGHASNTILAVAKERGADLIIIASHRPGLQDYFLGSTASKVVRHANCSVLVVR
ncbi:MAG TPA: universal stress protein [Gammaproteobacteria bacterium]|nr:universal stress protein [Gammaproteobacteria bacterium]